MKRITVVLASIFLLSAYNSPNGINDVINAIKAGNASAVAKYFDNTVEITVKSKSTNYSKAQGEVV